MDGREVFGCFKSDFRQHPQDYLDAFVSSVRGALEDAGPEAANQVRALAIDTTGSTPAPVNEQGVPLALLPEFQDNRDAMFYMWKDHSAIEEAKRINEVLANEGDQDYTRFQGTYSADGTGQRSCMQSGRRRKFARQPPRGWSTAIGCPRC